MLRGVVVGDMAIGAIGRKVRREASIFVMKKPKPILQKSFDTALILLKTVVTGADVADFLEIPYGQLLHLLYQISSEKKYKSFPIPKRYGGVRIIHKPCKGIDILQKKFKPFLDELYRVKQPVHGFVKERSIVSNAQCHVRQKYLLNIDIEDFYGAINFGRVRGLFLSRPFNLGEKAASIIAHLICFENRLPQGACTSPVISNFIAADLDKRLLAIAHRYHCTYSRYADDITFSTKKSKFPDQVASYEGDNPVTGKIILGDLVEKAFNDAGFKINHKKVRLQIQSIRQEVTGLTVNEFPNVKRKFVRQIRGMLHAWRKHGLIAAEVEYINKYCKKDFSIPNDELNGSYFRNVVYGKVAYLKMVRGDEDTILSKLASEVAQLDSEPPEYIRIIMKKSELYDVFIGHASEDKNTIALPIYRKCEELGIKAFLDEKYLKWGDSLTKKINMALGKSRFFLAILSENSIQKTWPQRELNSALSREISGEQKILPLIVGEPEKILKEVPLLHDKLYLKWEDNAQELVEKIKELKKS